MTATVHDLLDRDLAGYKLVNATMLELCHGLMACFPAVFSDSKEPIIFVDDLALEAAKKRLEQRKFKARQMLFLLDSDGASGFILQGYKPYDHKRCRVYTRHDHEANVAIEWAPGLI